MTVSSTRTAHLRVAKAPTRGRSSQPDLFYGLLRANNYIRRIHRYVYEIRHLEFYLSYVITLYNYRIVSVYVN